MLIAAAARVFAKWDYTADFDPTGALWQIRIDGAWYPPESFTVVAPTLTQPLWTGTLRLLVAGPDATGNPIGTVVLGLGGNPTTVMVPDSPETLVEDGGTITVTGCAS